MKLTLIISYGIFSSVIGLIDRLSKLWALEVGHYSTHYFACDLVFNKGIACGFFNEQAWFNVLTFMIVITYCFVIGYTIYRMQCGYSIWGECGVLVGGLSNLVDRFWYGSVIDFIVVKLPFFKFPIFNIADVAIVLGIFYMILTLQDYRFINQQKPYVEPH